MTEMGASPKRLILLHPHEDEIHMENYEIHSILKGEVVTLEFLPISGLLEARDSVQDSDKALGESKIQIKMHLEHPPLSPNENSSSSSCDSNIGIINNSPPTWNSVRNLWSLQATFSQVFSEALEYMTLIVSISDDPDDHKESVTNSSLRSSLEQDLYELHHRTEIPNPVTLSAKVRITHPLIITYKQLDIPQQQRASYVVVTIENTHRKITLSDLQLHLNQTIVSHDGPPSLTTSYRALLEDNAAVFPTSLLPHEKANFIYCIEETDDIQENSSLVGRFITPLSVTWRDDGSSSSTHCLIDEVAITWQSPRTRLDFPFEISLTPDTKTNNNNLCEGFTVVPVNVNVINNTSASRDLVIMFPKPAEHPHRLSTSPENSTLDLLIELENQVQDKNSTCFAVEAILNIGVVAANSVTPLVFQLSLLEPSLSNVKATVVDLRHFIYIYDRTTQKYYHPDTNSAAWEVL